MTTYKVTATRDGGWWSLIAHDVEGREVASQSRRLDQADAMIRDAIALVRDVPTDSFEVEITPTLDEVGVSAETVELLALRRQLSDLTERSRRLTPVAVAELRAAGLTVRDVAELVGLTPSRISQIEHRESAPTRRIRG
jgi:DNA-directed RNA polymerase specialized sigma subunit